MTPFKPTFPFCHNTSGSLFDALAIKKGLVCVVILTEASLDHLFM